MKRNAVRPALSHLPVTFCIVIGLGGAPAGAADTTGELHGVVVGPGGAPLPGARVSLSSEVLIGGVRGRVSGEDGGFAFRVLPPGGYLVRVELDGFTSVEAEAVVRLNRRTHLRIEMAAEGDR